MAASVTSAMSEALRGDQGRFWQYVDRRDDGDCWPWIRGRHTHGYGVYYPPGCRGLLAHRAALILSTGEEPNGRHALHSCDNPACCNPKHLRWGTHADNMRDMQARGRAKPGRTLPDRCKKGHNLTDMNNVITGSRTQRGRTYVVHKCRECNRQRLAQKRAERKLISNG